MVHPEPTPRATHRRLSSLRPPNLTNMPGFRVTRRQRGVAKDVANRFNAVGRPINNPTCQRVHLVI
jgi:hypothetical protein